MPGHRSRRWKRGMLLVGIVALAATGIALSVPPAVGMIAAACLGTLCLLCLLLPPLRHPTPILATAAAAVFLLSGSIQCACREQPMRAFDGTADTVSGQTVARVGKNGAVIQVTQAQTLPSGTKVLLFCPEQSMPALYDTVSASVTLKTPDRTRPYLRGQGIFLTASPTLYGEDAVTAAPGRVPYSDPLYSLRCTLTQRIRRRLPGDEGALLCALCLGVKDGLPDYVTDDFRTCGLPHLLVVSGLHLTLVTGSVYALLRRLRLHPFAQSGFSAAAVVFYALLVGLTPSVCRAAIMCLCLIAGKLLRRRADSLNSLGLALTLILLINPYALLDVSFQLTFVAAAGILLITPRLREWMTAPQRTPPRWRPLCHAVADSLAATAGSLLPLLPLLAWYFRRLSLIAPLANLLAVVPAGWMLTAGCLGLLLSGVPLIGGGLSAACLLLSGLAGRFLLWLTDGLARLPLADVPLTRPWQYVWLFIAAAALTVAVRHGRRRHWLQLGGVLMAVLILAAAADALLMREVTQVTVFPGPAAAVVVRRGEACAVYSRNAAALDRIANAWGRQSDHRPQLLLLEGGAGSDCACVTDFVRQYPAQRLTVTNPQAEFLPGLPLTYAIDTRAVIPLSDTAVLIRESDRRQIRTGNSTLTLYPDGSIALSGLDRPLTVTQRITFTTRSTGEWSIEPWN